MNLDHYELRAGINLYTFEFVSEGSKGKISKVIRFQRLGVHNLYNLAFGDKDPATGKFDDRTVTNNGDSNKVLATVVSAIYAFTERNPDSWIYGTGRTAARSRLYQKLSKFN